MDYYHFREKILHSHKEHPMDPSHEAWYLEYSRTVPFGKEKHLGESLTTQAVRNEQVYIKLDAQTLEKALDQARPHWDAVSHEICSFPKIVKYSGKPGCSFILSSAAFA